MTRFGSLHKVSRTVEVKRQRQVFGSSARMVRGPSPRATIERWLITRPQLASQGLFLQSLNDFDHLKSIVRSVQRHAQRMAKVKWRRELGELNLLNLSGSALSILDGHVSGKNPRQPDRDPLWGRSSHGVL